MKLTGNNKVVDSDYELSIQDEIRIRPLMEEINNQNIELITNLSKLNRNLFSDDFSKTLVLMMSSGNFGGFNFKKFISYIENF